LRVRKCGAFLALLIALAPLRGMAASAQFRKLVKQAGQLYQSSKYAEAADLLKQAYDLQPNPRLLYNIARAYDQAGSLREAADFYERYVGSAEGTDPQLLKRSAQALERVRRLLQKEDEDKKRQEAEKQRAEAERQRAEAEAKAAQERAAADAAAARKAQAEAEARNREQVQMQLTTRSRRRVAAFVTGGIGIAAAGVGVGFGIGANNAYSQFHAAQDAADKETLANKTKNDALYADIGYGVGAALLATALIVYPKGSDPTLVLAPTLNGAMLVGRF
jgi:tetratricopeptide (TPR) repeat protein